ncbi:MAG: hypothetical protein HYR94_00735 [Chloroflexi bacterium]|nr:hypothetical protein [Chloroflexota bacterium]
MYNTAAIRELLSVVFSDDEFEIFCYDNFRPVYRGFSSQMGHLMKIQLLIDYCERYDHFDELLIQLKKINPKQYNKFIFSISKGQVEIVIRGDLPNFTPEIEVVTVRALAGILNIPCNQISVLQVQTSHIESH